MAKKYFRYTKINQSTSGFLRERASRGEIVIIIDALTSPLKLIQEISSVECLKLLQAALAFF